MDQISQVFLLFTCFHIPLLQILSGNDSRNMLGNLERPCGIGRVKIYWMKRLKKQQNIRYNMGCVRQGGFAEMAHVHNRDRFAIELLAS